MRELRVRVHNTEKPEKDVLATPESEDGPAIDVAGIVEKTVLGVGTIVGGYVVLDTIRQILVNKTK